MATTRWIAAAGAVAQVSTVQVTAYHASTTYRLTVNGKSVSVIAAGSVNATAAALEAAWNASAEPEFAEATALAATDTVTLTADTAGVPFTVTPSVSGGTGTIGAATTATASTGPNHWDNAANWSTGSVPVTGDNIWIENSSVSVLYGLNQSAVTPASVNLAASFTGTLGLPEINQSGSAAYHEYRAQYLQLGGGTAINVGDGPGQGSGRIKIDTGTGATTLTVRGTSSSLETDLEALQWKGTHASNVVNVFRGSVGIAGYAGDAATVATLRVGFVTSENGDATVRCGPGCTLTTIEQSGGTLEINTAATTITKTAGELTVKGSGGYTTITNDKGTVYYLSTGTTTNTRVGSDATVDCSRDMRPRTFTNAVQLYAGATWIDPAATCTFGAGLKLNRCAINEVTLDLGQDRTLTPS